MGVVWGVDQCGQRGWGRPTGWCMFDWSSIFNCCVLSIYNGSLICHSYCSRGVGSGISLDSLFVYIFYFFYI